MTTPTIDDKLAELASHHPAITPLQLCRLLEQAFLMPAVQDAILDAIDELLANRPTPSPHPQPPETLDAIAHLANIRAHLRAIAKVSTTHHSSITIPINLWHALIMQAKP